VNQIENRGAEVTFKKGQSGNPGGRPKALVEIVELAREATPEAIKTLKKIMLDEQAPHAARVAACNALMDRAFGKPLQTTLNYFEGENLEEISDDEFFDTIAKVRSFAGRHGATKIGKGSRPPRRDN
jgi:Family of unknown function (DUF5681)